jgi:signal transduction histidine kinase
VVHRLHPLHLVAVVALVSGGTVAYLAATSDHAEPRIAAAIIGPLVAWSFVGVGLIAWRRRPGNAVGRLFVATGLAFLLALLTAANSAALFTVGLVLEAAYIAVVLHAVLAFPGGRLEGRLARMLVVGAYLDTIVVSFAWALVAQPNALMENCPDCPDNLLVVAESETAAEAIAFVQQPLVGGSLLLVTIVVLARRWRSASVPLRRVLAPVLWTGGGAIAFETMGLLLESGGVEAADLAYLLALVSLGAMPFAFLLGMLRARLARSEVGRILVETPIPTPEAAEEGLRRALGDPSLVLAYWQPDTDSFADVQGRPVALPAPTDSRRTATLVEHAGRPIAALVHDAALLGEPELVRAVVGAARLGFENERLNEELRARLEDLRASRARLVESAATERRRLERNLHDGAQQRLVAVALTLRLARARVHTDADAAADLLEQASAELARALAELREIARGIHPAVLTERGLEPAVRALADRCPVDVEVAVALPERLPANVEEAAYYVVAEALANVLKYAGASSVRISVGREDGTARVEVTDDGVGGADPARGSGLRGLADRVEALDGRLEIDSPPSRGTRLSAEIPL